MVDTDCKVNEFSAPPMTKGGPRMDHDEETIRQLYDRFNDRDMEAVFSLLTDDVAWANGMDGTHVHGKEAIREYWAHQW